MIAHKNFLTMKYFQTTVLILLDTRALVRFMNEESTAIVPVGRLEKKDTIEYNGSCKVKWSNQKRYHAFLLFSGKDL